MSKDAHIILLTGYARSGKDSVAQYLVDNHGFSQIYFAEPMYEMLETMFQFCDPSIDIKHIEENKKETTPLSTVTFRHALQTLGTEWGRTHIAEDIWPAIAFSRMVNLYNEGKRKIVISDCRFENEYEYFNREIGQINELSYEQGFELDLWHISRNASEPQTHHASEQDIETLKKKSTFIINNNATLDDLHGQVELRVAL